MSDYLFEEPPEFVVHLIMTFKLGTEEKASEMLANAIHSNKLVNTVCDTFEDGPGGKGQYLIHLACINGWISVMKTLVQEGKCSVDVRDLDGKSPLHYACKDGNKEIVSYLVTKCNCPVNLRDRDGNTPLHFAVLHKQTHVIVSLTGAEIVPNREGQTAFHLACMAGDLSIIYELNRIQCLTSITKDAHRNTPMHLACRAGNQELVEYLFSLYPESISEKNWVGNMPLHLACESGHDAVVNVLVRKFPEQLAIQNENGKTPLMAAVENRKTGVVKMLAVMAECPLTAQDQNGDTVLHIACRTNNTRAVHSILSTRRVGPELFIMNANRKTPFTLTSNTSIAKMLQPYQASVGHIVLAGAKSFVTVIKKGLWATVNTMQVFYQGNL